MTQIQIPAKISIAVTAQQSPSHTASGDAAAGVFAQMVLQVTAPSPSPAVAEPLPPEPDTDQRNGVAALPGNDGQDAVSFLFAPLPQASGRGPDVTDLLKPAARQSPVDDPSEGTSLEEEGVPGSDLLPPDVGPVVQIAATLASVGAQIAFPSPKAEAGRSSITAWQSITGLEAEVPSFKEPVVQSLATLASSELHPDPTAVNVVSIDAPSDMGLPNITPGFDSAADWRGPVCLAGGDGRDNGPVEKALTAGKILGTESLAQSVVATQPTSTPQPVASALGSDLLDLGSTAVSAGTAVRIAEFALIPSNVPNSPIVPMTIPVNRSAGGPDNGRHAEVPALKAANLVFSAAGQKIEPLTGADLPAPPALAMSKPAVVATVLSPIPDASLLEWDIRSLGPSSGMADKDVPEARSAGQAIVHGSVTATAGYGSAEPEIEVNAAVRSADGVTLRNDVVTVSQPQPTAHGSPLTFNGDSELQTPPKTDATAKGEDKFQPLPAGLRGEWMLRAVWPQMNAPSEGNEGPKAAGFSPTTTMTSGDVPDATQRLDDQPKSGADVRRDATLPSSTRPVAETASAPLANIPPTSTPAPLAPLSLTPAPHSPAEPSRAAPPAPASLPLQIVQAVSTNGPVTELRLSPEELGHVRIDMRQEGERIMMTVSAERQDTLDLLRRHAGDLAAELRAAGHQGLDLSFGQWSGAGGQPQAEPSPAAPPAPVIAPEEISVLPTQAQDMLPGTGLYLRI